jgi:uncharacterized membrane protein
VAFALQHIRPFQAEAFLPVQGVSDAFNNNEGVPMDILNVVLRWLHVAAGILWIGHLYFFNFVNTQLAGVLDGDTKKKVVPELMPRALYWFRWGAAYTWITGVLLLMLVFYHGDLMFEIGVEWGMGATIMLVVTFAAFALYDVLAKGGLAKNLKTFGAVCFVILVVITYLMIEWGQFSYRAYNIHVGVMLGTIMAANVWMRIWPSQRKIIAAVKGGTPPDQAVVGLAGMRSRHNTYMSVPLLYTMINAHTVVPGADSVLYLFVVILLGWGAVAYMYKKAGILKGF